MNIRDLFPLDHFFLMVKPPVFEKLKELSGILKNTVYDRIERPDTWYEGIYVFAENETYFELMNNPEDKYDFYLGVGWSSKDPGVIDVDTLPEEFPNLEWQKLENIVKQISLGKNIYSANSVAYKISYTNS